MPLASVVTVQTAEPHAANCAEPEVVEKTTASPHYGSHAVAGEHLDAERQRRRRTHGCHRRRSRDQLHRVRASPLAVGQRAGHHSGRAGAEVVHLDIDRRAVHRIRVGHRRDRKGNRVGRPTCGGRGDPVDQHRVARAEAGAGNRDCAATWVDVCGRYGIGIKDASLISEIRATVAALVGDSYTQGSAAAARRKGRRSQVRGPDTCRVEGRGSHAHRRQASGTVGRRKEADDRHRFGRCGKAICVERRHLHCEAAPCFHRSRNVCGVTVTAEYAVPPAGRRLRRRSGSGSIGSVAAGRRRVADGKVRHDGVPRADPEAVERSRCRAGGRSDPGSIGPDARTPDIKRIDRLRR